jgi:uncharacterized protein YkwD
MHIPARLASRLAFLLVALLLPIAPVSAQPAAQTTSGGFTVYVPMVMLAGAQTAAVSIEQQVVDLTNDQRRQNGCDVALTISPELAAAAAAHSQDLALNDIFSHTGSDGSTMITRIAETGYSYSQIAENIAAGQSTPQDVVDAWMRSPGHRANILNCALREIGVGYYDQADDQANVRLDGGRIGGPYRFYWTQDFGAH